MDKIDIFMQLAIIIVVAEVGALLAKMIKVPRVAGQIVAGLLIGPSVFGLVQKNNFLDMMAEIGVVLLMFSAGLETNIQDLKKTGLKAFFIACAGVLVPLLGGFVLNSCLYGFAHMGSEQFIKNLFVGVILTATSVSITVQSLREMGRLQGEVGTTILNAAIIDDVIGIMVLTFVIGMKNPDNDIIKVTLSTVGFFAVAVLGGFVIYRVFKMFDMRYEHHRRIPILGLGLCFAFSFIAEEIFGIADITGAYMAGIILCSLKDADYIARRTDISSYMIFGPIFFSSIGLNTRLDGFGSSLLLFTIGFVAVGLLTKIIGCGLMARLCKFKWNDCLKIGIGMMTRGEVALIVAQKGMNEKILDSRFFAAVIVLIIFSSILTPVLLKVLYRGEPENV